MLSSHIDRVEENLVFSLLLNASRVQETGPGYFHTVNVKILRSGSPSFALPYVAAP